MKYAHIGIDDQAKAVSNLPALHGRCILGVVGGPSMTPDVTNTEDQKRQNPCGNKGFGVSRHSVSVSVKMEAAGIEPAASNELANSRFHVSH